MIITSTGFFNTGSSAVTHLLSEFTEIQNTDGVYEFRLLYDTDCIRDLEYNLIENPHRHNTSNAIKLFKKWVDFNSNPLLNHHIEKMCNNNFKKFSYEYINDLCDVVYKGMYYQDVYNRGKLFWFINRCHQKFASIICKNKIFLKIMPLQLVPKSELCYAGTFDENKFLTATKNYVRKILDAFSKGKKYKLIDQFIPSTNIDKYLRYIPDDEECKVFVVDRDPRDLYCTAKYFLDARVIPIESVEKFCQWYKWSRGQSEKNISKNACYIKFEDLIYRYEETRNKVCEYVGLDPEADCNKKSIFVPEKSVNNTQVWKRFKDVNLDDIAYIEKNLSKYCYDFPENSDMQPDFSKINMFDC